MSVRLAWATDVHFNFLSDAEVDIFVSRVMETNADGLVLCGDIAESHDFAGHLEDLAERIKRPIYFVLGNHDFYKGSIRKVRAKARALSRNNPWLWWLPDVGVLELTEDVALMGHDGWSDGRLGDYQRSTVRLNDYMLISELSGLTHKQRLLVLNRLGDEAAAFAREVLQSALSRFEKKVVFVTHPPPFAEACWHDGRLSNDDWLPHFACGALGEALLEAAEGFPQRDILVLCGHTHGAGEVTIRPNLSVLTGGAIYGAPSIAGVLEF